MEGLVFSGKKLQYKTDVPVPTITSPNDVVVKVQYCGVCGTDLHALSVGIYIVDV